MRDRRQTVYLLITLSLLTGLFTGRAFFFNLAYMLIGLFLVTLIWSWLAVRQISIQRKTRSSRAQVGQKLEEGFAVRNSSFIPKLWLEVYDHSNLPQHKTSQIIAGLGPRATHRWQVKTRCLSRGEFRLGPMTITSGDPFGLFLLRRHIPATTRIIVYPAIVPLTRVELPMGILSGGEAIRRRTHYITTNAAGVRDYAPGDGFNRIHWPSTARKDQLIVKEFELDPLVDIWLFADFSRTSLAEDPSVKRVDGTGPVIPTGRSLIPPSSEEYVAVVAASLARYFINQERVIGFVTYTPNREIHHPERGNRQLARILETLAVARSLSDYTLEQMLSLETPHFARGATLLIVTASLDKKWVVEAQILNRRGIRPLCVLIDPATFGGQESIDTVRGMLNLARIPAITIKRDTDIAAALAQRLI